MSRWKDADYEVYARSAEHFYGNDLQREPPLVSDTMPAARIFNWRLPAPKQSRISQVIHTGLRVWHFVRLTISDFAYSAICQFLGHTMTDTGYAYRESGCMETTCTRCGQYSALG